MSGFLHDVIGDRSEAEVVARNITECLDKLEIQFPGLKKQLYDERGEVHRFIEIFVNGDNVRSLQGLATALSDGDEVCILPAFAGG